MLLNGQFCLLLGAALLIGLASSAPLVKQPESRFIDQAKKLLEENMLIDGHNDWPYMLRLNFDNQLGRVNLTSITKEEYTLTANSGATHTDIRRLKEGRLGGQFWAAYASCDGLGKDAALQHMEQLDVIRRYIEKYPDTFEYTTSVEEMRNAFRNKKIASLIGLESGHAIDSSLSLLRMFYDLGVRYMTLTHNCNTPWATQNQINRPENDPNADKGLSEFGERVVLEMNRIGMMVDISHVSYQTMKDVLRVSRAPVIFSHSSVYAICDHTRNARDDVLFDLQKNKGIIMINFYTGFIKCDGTNEPVTVDHVIDHFDYIKRLLNSVDNIGIGSDYDGVNQVPSGLDDVSYFPNLFARMLERGWEKSELVKIAGENLLRVFSDVEKYSKSVSNEEPINDIIPQEDLGDLYKDCRTQFQNIIFWK